MSAQHYAAKIASLINEAQEEGFEVSISPEADGIWVDERFIAEPKLSDETWEVTE